MHFVHSFLLKGKDWRVVALLSAALFVVGLFYSQARQQSSLATPQAVEIWSYICEVAALHDLPPEFVYAIATAESHLIAHAQSESARGLMQLSRIAWREVSDAPYREAWDWRANIRAGVDYLDFCRKLLRGNNAESYALLAACFRYGPYYVQRHDFDIAKIQAPKNIIYQKLFAGVVAPVPAPHMLNSDK
ncbi:MAG: transglycosylase SLT domain-containing protein [Opitutales bacterium]